MSYTVGVLVPRPYLGVLTYEVQAEVLPALGKFVRVPLGNGQVIGVVWTHQTSIVNKKLKMIDEIFEDLPVLSGPLLKFMGWVAEYYMQPLGSVLKLLLVSEEFFNLPKKKSSKNEDLPYSFRHVDLTLDQEQAVEQIKAFDSKPLVLEGVTGSGKTEVYFEAIETLLENKQQALILLPEIALSAQFIARFQSRFGRPPLVWHSALTPAQRRNVFQSILKNESHVVIGARSALFLPFQSLGLIVVDEEHDSSYKQEEGLPYHARDMAVLYGKLLSCPVLLVSATPSLETINNYQQGRYKHVLLPVRYGEAKLPQIELISLKEAPPKKGSWLSSKLIDVLKENYEKGLQSLLFLNRRGYAPVAMCKSCGHRLECVSCSSTLVYHSFLKQFICHHCGYALAAQLSKCLSCGHEDSMILCGPGVERIQEEVKKLFPGANSLILSSDLMTTPKKIKEAIEAIERREVHFIIGTQMISKGYHFPYLTCVGVVDGDLGLYGTDLRAVERTYQLLHQVAGRSGREKHEGHVYIQTYETEHPLMRALVHNQHEALMDLELRQRAFRKMPPFGRLVAFVFSGKDQDKTHEEATKMVQSAPFIEGVTVYGPAPAPLFLKKGLYRYRILLKVDLNISVQKYLKQWLDPLKMKGTIKRTVDVDPYSFF
jgi:primosomal protein N' (replication factor Y) (superfamily II helicase)